MNLSEPATAMMPIAPVRATCVPPHADTSKSSTSISRSTPSRFDSLRSGSLRGFVGVGEADRDRTILPDDAVGFALGARDLVGGHLAREIDRRRRRAEVEADRPHLQQAVERRRQHVLAGVLLHVLEAPRPVDRCRAPALPQRRLRPRAGCCRRRGRRRRRRARRRACRCRTAGRPTSDRRRCDRARRRERLACRLERARTLTHRRVELGRYTDRCSRMRSVSRHVFRVESSGSVTPASAKPFARRRQLSQRPHGAPAARIVAAVRQAVVEPEREAAADDLGLRQVQRAARGSSAAALRRRPSSRARPSARRPRDTRAGSPDSRSSRARSRR